MFYQPIVLTQDLYSAYNRSLEDFPVHWHSDLEIIYCAKGSFSAQIDKSVYKVHEGQILFVESSLPHAYYDCVPENKITLIRVGSVFFGNALFMEIAKKQLASPVLEYHEETVRIFKRIASICTEKNKLENNLEIQGLIYTLMLNLFRNLPQYAGGSLRRDKRLQYVLSVQKTLDYVSTNFHQEISVETAARISGYEKSAFCRIFKQATDTSFHQYLSQYRINIACILLSESSRTVSEIAQSVGIQELKNFCRVFKQIMGMTPSAYRETRKI